MTKTLPTKFKRKGFEWSLLSRRSKTLKKKTKHFGLFKQGNSHYVACEILQGKKHPLTRKEWHVVERIPSDNKWGQNAFTSTDFMDMWLKWSDMIGYETNP